MAITLDDALAEADAAALAEIAQQIRDRDEGMRRLSALLECCQTSGDACKSHGFAFELDRERMVILRSGVVIAFWMTKDGMLSLVMHGKTEPDYTTSDVDDAVRKTAAIVRAEMSVKRGRVAA